MYGRREAVIYPYAIYLCPVQIIFQLSELPDLGELFRYPNRRASNNHGIFNTNFAAISTLYTKLWFNHMNISILALNCFFLAYIKASAATCAFAWVDDIIQKRLAGIRGTGLFNDMCFDLIAEKVKCTQDRVRQIFSEGTQRPFGDDWPDVLDNGQLLAFALRRSHVRKDCGQMPATLAANCAFAA